MSTPADAVLAALDRAGRSWRPSGDGKWTAQCPAHDDRNPSLSIRQEHDRDGVDKVLLYCFAGCETEDVVSSLRLEWSDLFDGKAEPWLVPERQPTRPRPYHADRGPDPDHDSTERSSWAPVDVDPVLRGEQLEEPPTMLPRTDGVALIYPGRIHALNAESESGKTWAALYLVLACLLAGEHVVYFDFEDTATSVVGRLLNLGADPDQIREFFHYVSPDEPMAGQARGDFQALVDLQPALVVLDGMTEAYTLQSLDGHGGGDVAKFLGLFARPFKRAGATVLLLDHVVKDPKAQGRFATGSQHKLAGVDVAYGLQVVKPFGRGLNGHARLTVEKDRPGHVRQHAEGKAIADLHFASGSAGTVTVTVRPPGTDEPFRPTALMQRVSYAIETAGDPLSKRAIIDAVSGKDKYVAIALATLIAEGYVQATTGGRGKANLHTTVKPYRAAEEPDRGPVAQPRPNRSPDTADGGCGPVAHRVPKARGDRATPTGPESTHTVALPVEDATNPHAVEVEA